MGSRVNMPGMWIMAAVTVGGGIGGPIGMLLSVPIASAAYTLLREATKNRERQQFALQAAGSEKRILDRQDDHIRYDKTELRPQRRSDRRQECLSDQWQAGRSHGDAGPHAGITIVLYDERLRRLTKAQWIGVLDFVKYTGAKLLISLSSCAAWGRSICARQRRSSASATTMA